MLSNDPYRKTTVLVIKVRDLESRVVDAVALHQYAEHILRFDARPGATAADDDWTGDAYDTVKEVCKEIVKPRRIPMPYCGFSGSGLCHPKPCYLDVNQWGGSFAGGDMVGICAQRGTVCNCLPPHLLNP